MNASWTVSPPIRDGWYWARVTGKEQVKEWFCVLITDLGGTWIVSSHGSEGYPLSEFAEYYEYDPIMIQPRGVS